MGNIYIQATQKMFSMVKSVYAMLLQWHLNTVMCAVLHENACVMPFHSAGRQHASARCAVFETGADEKMIRRRRDAPGILLLEDGGQAVREEKSVQISIQTIHCLP